MKLDKVSQDQRAWDREHHVLWFLPWYVKEFFQIVGSVFIVFFIIICFPMLVTARLGCTSARPAIHGTVTDKRFQIAISRKGVKPDKVWTTISKEEFENTKVGEKWYGTYDP